MKRISLSLLVVCLLFTLGSPVSAGDFTFALAQDGISTSGLWNSLGPSAESFVSTLAREEEKNRKIGGIFATGTGLVLLGLGALYNDEDPADEEDGKRAFYTTGGIITALGVCRLAIPSYVEFEYERILKIEDPHKREQASYATLVNVANQARISRLSAGVISGALCLYFLNRDTPSYLSDDFDRYNALIYGALCVCSFLVESTPEKMLKEYQEGQSNLQKNSSFAILPQLDGTITAVYTYKF
ncbi:MAG TPA: hypothetical protein GXZ36_10310 [Firmicutes bacterium]|nr:hypothetical protein [Bacillota bacterium]